jgi:hypothetical protein
MSQENMMEFWEGTLIQFDGNLLSNQSLSKETKDFLASIGLPVKSEFLKDLSLCFYDYIEQICINDSNYIIIGDDYGTKICIKEKTDEVVSVDIETENIRFINSGIKSFVDFLQIYFTKRPELVGADDKEAVEIINSIKDSFNKLDAAALSNEDNWWAVILEQNEQGLM